MQSFSSSHLVASRAWLSDGAVRMLHDVAGSSIRM
jgi:hypothetical protein